MVARRLRRKGDGRVPWLWPVYFGRFEETGRGQEQQVGSRKMAARGEMTTKHNVDCYFWGLEMIASCSSFDKCVLVWDSVHDKCVLVWDTVRGRGTFLGQLEFKLKRIKDCTGGCDFEQRRLVGVCGRQKKVEYKCTCGVHLHRVFFAHIISEIILLMNDSYLFFLGRAMQLHGPRYVLVRGKADWQCAAQCFM
jgi:hypothetical protein